MKFDQLAFLDSAHVHLILERGVEFEGQTAAGFGQIGCKELAGNAVDERRKAPSETEPATGSVTSAASVNCALL